MNLLHFDNALDVVLSQERAVRQKDLPRGMVHEITNSLITIFGGKDGVTREEIRNVVPAIERQAYLGAFGPQGKGWVWPDSSSLNPDQVV